MENELDASIFHKIAIQKDLYKRVLEMIATADDGTQQWRIIQAIFEYIIFRFDADKKGLVIRYAKIGYDHEDGIHSLYETSMYGTSPWPLTSQHLVYWGRTHLAGWAAELQRMQRWEAHDASQYRPVDVDEHEQSSCAYPLLQADSLAGVLMISSVQPGFFSDPLVCEAVHECALLLTLAFDARDFYPCARLNLVIMPDLRWQRGEMQRVYVKRMLACVRQTGLPRRHAEAIVRREMELEFEKRVRSQLHATNSNSFDQKPLGS
jgi:hypothetical protein